jgi:hypothetical protein
MRKLVISLFSVAALLALTGIASAGPMSVASPQAVKPQTQIEQVAYRYHHRYYRHYGWYHHRYYRHYGWYHHRYYYGWNPAATIVGGAVGLATLPFAVATGWPYYYGYPYYW